jgi:hypothetical protein
MRVIFGYMGFSVKVDGIDRNPTEQTKDPHSSRDNRKLNLNCANT